MFSLWRPLAPECAPRVARASQGRWIVARAFLLKEIRFPKVLRAVSASPTHLLRSILQTRFAPSDPQ